MIWLFFAPIALWIGFVFYASVKAHWNEIERPEVKLAALIVVITVYPIDLAIGTVVGLLTGVLTGWTLTQKLKAMKKIGGRRAVFATYLCANWINTFEQGHC